MISVMTGIQLIHSLWRWVVTLLVVATLAKSLMGWLGSQQYAAIDRSLYKYTVGAIALQFVLGIVLLTGNLIFVYSQIPGLMGLALSHALTMILAVVATMMGSVRSRKATDDKSKFMIQAIALLVAVLLIWVGVAMLPAGWSLTL